MLYDAPSEFILYKAILFSIHNSRIARFPWYFALKLRNACHYKLAYTETLKIKIISNLQNENARRFFCSYQSTRSLANQNACFKSCFYVKAASLSYDDINFLGPQICPKSAVNRVLYVYRRARCLITFPVFYFLVVYSSVSDVFLSPL